MPTPPQKTCPESPTHDFGRGARRCPNERCKAHVLDDETCPACGIALDRAEPVCRTCTEALVAAYPPPDPPDPPDPVPTRPRAKLH